MPVSNPIRSLKRATQMKPMKHRFAWASALALAVTLTSQIQSFAATNGMILITTRREQDLSYGVADSGNKMGPGQVSAGDVSMSAVLGDYGYSSRLILDAELTDTGVAG